jgi:hypothetical protein
MTAPDAATTIVEVPRTEESHDTNEKLQLATNDEKKSKSGIAESPEIAPVPPAYDNDSSQEKEDGSEDVIIITGADAAAHLLPLRDDHDPSLTFRGLVLATVLSAFQAVMYQIYTVSIYSC